MSEADASTPMPPQSVPPDQGAAARQPRWRRDFPIDWQQDDYVSRRDFCKYMILTSAALVVGQATIGLKSLIDEETPAGPELEIARVDDLAVGEGKTFFYPEGSTPRLLVRAAPDKFVAYDQLCTHLLCPIMPAVEQGKLHCPCHNGWFDLATGDPVAGPPRRKLQRILLEVRDGKVFAVGVEGSQP
jgi:Rieske Fe-S protein